MKKLILVLFLILSTNALADTYVIENDDGSVRVLNYNPNSGDALEDVLKELGAQDLPVVRVNPVNLPPSKADRKYWMRSGNKVIVDTAKKQADLDLKTQEEQARKTKARSIFKLTDQEYQDAKQEGFLK